MAQKSVDDKEETIKEASEKSGSRKMLEELAEKKRKEQK